MESIKWQQILTYHCEDNAIINKISESDWKYNNLKWGTGVWNHQVWPNPAKPVGWWLWVQILPAKMQPVGGLDKSGTEVNHYYDLNLNLWQGYLNLLLTLHINHWIKYIWLKMNFSAFCCCPRIHHFSLSVFQPVAVSVSNGSRPSLRVWVRVQTKLLPNWPSGTTMNLNCPLRYSCTVHSQPVWIGRVVSGSPSGSMYRFI
jgi:hypothetical protein